jgi:hypothetical protein
MGTKFILRAGTGNNIFPTMYYSWKMPGDTGGDFYRDNIAHCNTTTIPMNVQMTQEPGAMEGPTIQGIQDLMAQDPNAKWDDFTKQIVNSNASGQSPRVFPIPLYDPDAYQAGKMNGRDATLISRNWLGFFVEGFNGNEVYGRIVPITGVIDDSLPAAPDGIFPRAIRLVK